MQLFENVIITYLMVVEYTMIFYFFIYIRVSTYKEMQCYIVEDNCFHMFSFFVFSFSLVNNVATQLTMNDWKQGN